MNLVEYHPAALEELIQAAEYYESRVEGLGERFLDEIEQAITDVSELPERWTHYRLLLRVENDKARYWYMEETATQNWTTRALERQIGTLFRR